MVNILKRFVLRWNMEILENYKIADLTIPIVLNGSHAIFINKSNEEVDALQKHLDEWFDTNNPDYGFSVIGVNDDHIEALAIITERLVGYEDLSSWNNECSVFTYKVSRFNEGDV